MRLLRPSIVGGAPLPTLREPVQTEAAGKLGPRHTLESRVQVSGHERMISSKRELFTCKPAGQHPLHIVLFDLADRAPIGAATVEPYGVRVPNGRTSIQKRVQPRVPRQDEQRLVARNISRNGSTNTIHGLGDIARKKKAISADRRPLEGLSRLRKAGERTLGNG